MSALYPELSVGLSCATKEGAIELADYIMDCLVDLNLEAHVATRPGEIEVVVYPGRDVSPENLVKAWEGLRWAIKRAREEVIR